MKQEFIKKIKGIFLQKDSLIICILTGVLLLIISWPVKDSKGEQGTEEDSFGEIMYEEKLKQGIERGEALGEKVVLAEAEEKQQTQRLEQRLEEFLKVMEGVGNVKVMITLDSLGEKVLEKDIPVEQSVITEQDSQGGSRSTNDTNSKEETVYITDERGNKYPYVITETLPKIKGVTVVCQGGGSDLIQKNITEVIQALFGIEAHKIKIVKMKQME